MSYRVLMWVIAAAVLVAIVTVIDLAKEREDGPVFIASSRPITEDQSASKNDDRRMDQRVDQPGGRYFQVMGSKDQQTAHLVVNSRRPVVYGVTMMTEINRKGYRVQGEDFSIMRPVIHKPGARSRHMPRCHSRVSYCLSCRSDRSGSAAQAQHSPLELETKIPLGTVKVGSTIWPSILGASTCSSRNWKTIALGSSI